MKEVELGGPIGWHLHAAAAAAVDMWNRMVIRVFIIDLQGSTVQVYAELLAIISEKVGGGDFCANEDFWRPYHLLSAHHRTANYIARVIASHHGMLTR